MPIHDQQHEQQQSPLFTLPPELRDTIYSLVLTKPQPISPQRQSHRQEERQILQLFRTSHRIRQESTKIYFSINTFLFFDDGELDEIELPLFFRSIPPGMLEQCTAIALEASLGPRHNAGGCPGKYCIGRVELDMTTQSATTERRTGCCGKDAGALEVARGDVQLTLTRWREKKGLERARLGGEVGRRFCAAFGHLHPDYGD